MNALVFLFAGCPFTHFIFLFLPMVNLKNQNPLLFSITSVVLTEETIDTIEAFEDNSEVICFDFTKMGFDQIRWQLPTIIFGLNISLSSKIINGT
jgi:hypothetical protein